MKQKFDQFLASELEKIESDGLFKEERLIKSPQSSKLETTTHPSLINLCSNNYLGLSNHPKIIEAAHQALKLYGYGMSSVRFICGTQNYS